jgi:hypothetical protein
MDDGTPDLKHLREDIELKEPAEDFVLPDEEELIASIIDELDMLGPAEEPEEYDVFGTGGMEMDSDPTDSITMGFARTSLSDGNKLNETVGQFGGVSGTMAGEHPYGEHPSRTLFVRNINSNVDDSELRAMFEVIFFALLIICKYKMYEKNSKFVLLIPNSTMQLYLKYDDLYLFFVHLGMPFTFDVFSCSNSGTSGLSTPQLSIEGL